MNHYLLVFATCLSVFSFISCTPKFDSKLEPGSFDLMEDEDDDEENNEDEGSNDPPYGTGDGGNPGDPRWTQLSTLPAQFLSTDIKVAPNGVPYVVGHASRAAIYRLDGSTWTEFANSAGSEPASCGSAWQPWLFFDKDQANFVENRDLFLTSRDYHSAGSLNVRQKTAQGWDVMNPCSGCPCYSGANPTDYDNAHYPAGVVHQNKPYVILNDGPSGDERPTVLERVNGTWEIMGTQRFANGHSKGLNIDVKDNELYASYSEEFGGAQRLVLKKFINNDWNIVATTMAPGAEYTAMCKAQNHLFVFTHSYHGGGPKALRAFIVSGGTLVPIGGIIATGIHMGQQNWIQRVFCGVDSQGRLYASYRFDDNVSPHRVEISRLEAPTGGVPDWVVFTQTAVTVDSVRFMSMDVSPIDDKIYIGWTNANEQMDTYSIQIDD